MRECNILCFTETRLTGPVPDTTVTLSNRFSMFCMDGIAESNKVKGGGICFMVNKKWCDARNISTLSGHCSPHLEYLIIKCQSFYLPCEFTPIITSNPPQADTGMGLSELHSVLSGFQKKHLDTALIVAGNFNKANLRHVMPNFYQHITCPTRGLELWATVTHLTSKATKLSHTQHLETVRPK